MAKVCWAKAWLRAAAELETAPSRPLCPTQVPRGYRQLNSMPRHALPAQLLSPKPGPQALATSPRCSNGPLYLPARLWGGSSERRKWAEENSSTLAGCRSELDLFYCSEEERLQKQPGPSTAEPRTAQDPGHRL